MKTASCEKGWRLLEEAQTGLVAGTYAIPLISKPTLKHGERNAKRSHFFATPLVPQTRLRPRKSQAGQSLAARRPQNGARKPSIASRHGSLGYKMAGAV